MSDSTETTDVAKIDTSKIFMDVETIKTVIPHRDPLLLIENVHEIIYEEKIIASKVLKKDEPVFAGHFPEKPVYPGVYYIEAIAQAGAVLLFESRKRRGIFDEAMGFLSSVEKAKFRKICGPGDKLVFEVYLIKARGPFFWLEGKVFSGTEIAAEASISVALGAK